jgi:hypothetical protein
VPHGARFLVGRFLEVLTEIGITDGDARRCGHQSADGAVKVEMNATQAADQSLALVSHSVLERVAQDAAEVRRDLRVLGPRRFGMVRPADHGPEGVVIGHMGEVQHADIRIEHARLAGIRHQPLAGTRDFMHGEPRRLEIRYRATQRGYAGADDLFLVARVHAGTQKVRSPQSHQVGRGVVVRRAHHGVIELPFRGQPPAHAHHVVMKEADRIQRDDSDTRVAVVEHAGDGPEVIVDRGRLAVLAETGEVHRASRIREVGVDFHAGESDAERARLSAGGLAAEIQVERVARLPVAEGKVAAHDHRQCKDEDERQADAQNAPPHRAPPAGRALHQVASLADAPTFGKAKAHIWQRINSVSLSRNVWTNFVARRARHRPVNGSNKSPAFGKCSVRSPAPSAFRQR